MIYRIVKNAMRTALGMLALLAGIAIEVPSSPARAQVPTPDAISAMERSFMSFDARLLSLEEKRLLQIGLAAAGDYVGVIDGAWGRRSQVALEAYGRRIDDEWAGEALFWHAIALAEWATQLLEAAGLDYRPFPAYGLQMIAPPGPLEIDREDRRIGRLSGPGLTYVLSRQDSYLASLLHDGFVGMHVGAEPPYTVRRDRLLVTSIEARGGRIYARSELTGAGDAWSTAVITKSPSGLEPLFKLVVASIGPDTGARARITRGSPFAATYSELTAAVGRIRQKEQEAAVRPPSAQSERPASAHRPATTDRPASPEESVGTGTAFYVNNVDLVTAAHVVDRCRRVTFVDGTPLRVVARHPRLDLAILTSDRRSRAWLSVHRTGEGRLGQRVYALGYPYFGLTGTGLNVTAGNISAARGLGDSTSEVTISAPVQPGNSGGPLLDSRGAIIGLVIAKLSPVAMLEAAQSLPENVNYAVRGVELIRFLDEQGILYPTGDGAGFDVEDGIPQTVQDAVVTIFCR